MLVSDGGLTEDQQRVLPTGTRYEQIGDQSTNRAISRLTVEPRGSGLHARVTVRNTGGPAATQTVRLDVDGITVTTLDVTLEPGEQKDLEIDLPPGDRVEAFLEGEDLLRSTTTPTRWRRGAGTCGCSSPGPTTSSSPRSWPRRPVSSSSGARPRRPATATTW